MYRHQVYLKPDLALVLLARSNEPFISVTTPFRVVIEGLSYVIPGDQGSFHIPIANVIHIETTTVKRS